MNPQEIQTQIVEEFSFLENWEDKYQLIIDLGRELKPMPEAHKTEENKVRGCQSQVWLFPVFENGKLFFEADSDAIIVKGLVALLMRVYSGQSPKAILDTPLFFIDAIGLSSNLSPTRSNGLASMAMKIKLYAADFAKRDA
jgi:cysteine desulfuration protein SufE